ncbi:hypothetical protein E4U21_007225, partial [Claviceps maximensis]
MTCAGRKYPLRQPPDHHPPVPRWQLVLPDDVTRIFTAYIGVQVRGGPDDADTTRQDALQKASARIKTWLQTASAHAPQAVEGFRVEQGDDVEGSAVWACYWDDEARGRQSLRELDLGSLYGEQLSRAEQRVLGLWSESFATAPARLETNYTG